MPVRDLHRLANTIAALMRDGLDIECQVSPHTRYVSPTVSPVPVLELAEVNGARFYLDKVTVHGDRAEMHLSIRGYPNQSMMVVRYQMSTINAVATEVVGAICDMLPPMKVEMP